MRQQRPAVAAHLQPLRPVLALQKPSPAHSGEWLWCRLIAALHTHTIKVQTRTQRPHASETPIIPYLINLTSQQMIYHNHLWVLGRGSLQYLAPLAEANQHMHLSGSVVLTALCHGSVSKRLVRHQGSNGLCGTHGSAELTCKGINITIW
jgi:hypothetical protein